MTTKDNSKLPPLTPDLYHARQVSDTFKAHIPWLRNFKVFTPPKEQTIEVRKDSK